MTQLIALDVDGTILNNSLPGPDDDPAGGHIDPELIEALHALRDAGHEIVVSTGRSVDATLAVVERLRIRSQWVVASNGAITLHRDGLGYRGYRREYVESFDPSEALKRIRSYLVTARFAVELEDGGFLYTEPINSGTLPMARRQVTFDELLGVRATRVVVVSPDHHLEEFVTAVDSLGLTHVSYAVGHTSWLDIAPDGVTKASALAVISERIGIGPSDVFAAGDGRNDIDMLRWAGRLGDSVAMGQAPPEVQAVASRVTAPVEEGGLLLALRERFPRELG